MPSKNDEIAQCRERLKELRQEADADGERIRKYLDAAEAEIDEAEVSDRHWVAYLGWARVLFDRVGKLL